MDFLKKNELEDKIVFREIELQDKPLFDRYLITLNTNMCEMTFSYMFIWRNYEHYRFAIVHDFLCIIANYRAEENGYAFMPIGDYTQTKYFIDTIGALKKYFLQKGQRLRLRVSETQVQYLKDLEIELKEVIYDRDNSDYVYSTKNLIELKGKVYDSKRNHIHKFKRKYDYEYVKLTNSSHKEECIKIMEKWCSSRKCNCAKHGYCEKYVNIELMKNYEYLDCEGCLIKVDGVYSAFSVGEKLSDSMAVIHIEKADNSIPGLYSVINQQFCEKKWSKYEYINREQDLGIEGLTKSKLSYKPVKFIKKYIVVLG